MACDSGFGWFRRRTPNPVLLAPFGGGRSGVRAGGGPKGREGSTQGRGASISPGRPRIGASRGRAEASGVVRRPRAAWTGRTHHRPANPQAGGSGQAPLPCNLGALTTLPTSWLT